MSEWKWIDIWERASLGERVDMLRRRLDEIAEPTDRSIRAAADVLWDYTEGNWDITVLELARKVVLSANQR